MKQYRRCYESHPPLPIGSGNTTYRIYGGSCSSPVVHDADVYVGLDDFSMRVSTMRYPWSKGVEFCFPIQDQKVPTSVEDFKHLISWLSEQLIANKKVHVGCVGGHGRTGLVFAALVTYMTDDLDSINYVRNNYCKKAVESQIQVDFLRDYFGIIPADIRKRTYTYSKGISRMTFGDDAFDEYRDPIDPYSDIDGIKQYKSRKNSKKLVW